MNTRIKKLAEQAGFQYIKDEGIGWAGNHNSSLPKFAELIVRECAGKVDWILAEGGKTQGDLIKEHFGIEQ